MMHARPAPALAVLPFLAQTSAEDPYSGLYEMGWSMEPIVAIVAVALSLIALPRVLALTTHRLFAHQPNPGIGVARAVVVFAPAWFWLVLQTGAASDIVGYYTILYAFFALAVLLWAGFRAPILGVYYPADVVERGNLAAALAIGGFAFGTAFAFGGALTGEGPGWWVVAVFFVLAYFELRANMAAVAKFGKIDEEMRLDRDVSAGLLLGAVAVASGLVSGRAAAGDFTGWGNDLPDYGKRLWPLVVIALIGIFAGASTRHSERKMLFRGVVGSALVVAGFAYYFLT